MVKISDNTEKHFLSNKKINVSGRYLITDNINIKQFEAIKNLSFGTHRSYLETTSDENDITVMTYFFKIISFFYWFMISILFYYRCIELLGNKPFTDIIIELGWIMGAGLIGYFCIWGLIQIVSKCIKQYL